MSMDWAGWHTSGTGLATNNHGPSDGRVPGARAAQTRVFAATALRCSGSWQAAEMRPGWAAPTRRLRMRVQSAPGPDHSLSNPAVTLMPDTKSSDLTVHCECPPGWVEPLRVHYWDRTPGGGGSVWPGLPMEPVSGRPGWYRHRFADTSSVRLLFADMQGRQTADLVRDRNGWLDAQGLWHDGPPARPRAAAAGGGPRRSAAPSPCGSPAACPGRSEPRAPGQAHGLPGRDHLFPHHHPLL